MDRGLRAQLSPNEESTLRLIGQAALPQHQPREADIAHLIALELVELREGTWHLTALGAQRLEMSRRK